jgi:hypothetical protein
MAKHYAMVVVVEVPDDVPAQDAWERNVEGDDRVFMGDPFRIPDDRRSDEYATVGIQLVGDERDPISLTWPSALEGGPDGQS